MPPESRSSYRIAPPLAQAFLELIDPAVSPRTVHLQVYGYNDLMLRVVASALRVPARSRANVPTSLWPAPLRPRLPSLRLLAVDPSDVGWNRPAAATGAGTAGFQPTCTPASGPTVLAKLRALRGELRAVPPSAHAPGVGAGAGLPYGRWFSHARPPNRAGVRPARPPGRAATRSSCRRERLPLHACHHDHAYSDGKRATDRRGVGGRLTGVRLVVARSRG